MARRRGSTSRPPQGAAKRLALLEVRGLTVDFHGEGGTVHAVDRVSFAVDAGRVLGVVGESGCGKSVSALSVTRLVPQPPGEIVAGEVLYKGRDLLKVPEGELPSVRGREIAMIFQDPMTSLNPVFRVGRLLTEVVRRHFSVSAREARERAVEALRQVGISEPENRLSAYPHELSGGMKQRVLIAMALLCEPTLLIADEPTTALDVTIQKQILHLLAELKEKANMALVLITHDIGVIAETADDVIVMYAGRVVESCDVYTLFGKHAHPYTHGLLNSVPARGQTKDQPLPTIEGTVPSLVNPPKGCRFASRCFRREEKCFHHDPPLVEHAPGHQVACHFPLDGKR